MVTDEIVDAALHKWFEGEGEEIDEIKADRFIWEIYQRDMRAAITAALEASGELERLRAALKATMKLYFDALEKPQDEQHLWLFSEEGMDAMQIARGALLGFEHEPLSDIARTALEGSTV